MAETFYTVDRLEGEAWAVLEDDTTRTFTIPRSWLPTSVREGDTISLLIDDHPAARTLRLTVTAAIRNERLADLEARRRQLPQGPKDDLSL